MTDQLPPTDLDTLSDRAYAELAFEHRRRDAWPATEGGDELSDRYESCYGRRT